MPTVRTTMQPDREFEVGAAEYLDLKRQGLLIEEEAPAPAPAPVAAPVAASKKTSSGAAGSKES
jgi:hypothetical protein